MSENVQYAIYPGIVTLYNGEQKDFTAEELAEAYGIQHKPYLVITDNVSVPKRDKYTSYIHLKPRPDDIYMNIKEALLDRGNDVEWGPDFPPYESEDQR